MISHQSLLLSTTVFNDIDKYSEVNDVIGASLSEPHHVRSTVKSVFLLACLLSCLLEALPYMAKNLFKCKPTLHQVHGMLTNITSNM